MSAQNINKRILFNINWDLDTNGVRKLELDAFKCLNSNINAVSNALYSPVDGASTKTDATLFFARKRLITLIDIWNRILNSGLFMKFDKWNQFYSTNTSVDSLKIIGSNIIDHKTEYLFKTWDTNGYIFPLDFQTSSIFYRIVKFIVACTNNFNWYKLYSIGKETYFNILLSPLYNDFGRNFLNINYNPDNAKFIVLMNELLDVVKDLLDETKVAALGFDFSGLDFGTTQGRTNILALDTYKSNYKALAKVDTSYLNVESQTLAQEWINTNSSNVKLLWPQFGTLITRNTENEAWAFRNVLIDTTGYTQSPVNKYQTKYIACSQVDMKKPLVFGTQFINWSNDMDQPYIMSYNGGTLIHLPDEIKDPIQVVDYERLNPDYTINNNYLYLPILPTGTKAIEFTLITDDTTYSNDWGRKIIGPSSAITTYENGICIAGGNYNEISWVNSNGTKRVVFVENGNYKNQTIKIKLENTDTGSNIYKNDILISTASVKFDFNSWAIGCTDVNRYSTGISITNLTYYYSVGNYLGEQPDNQLNLAANFWSIGTANDLDPNYKPSDDIKLKSIPELHNLDKLDYLDNLTLYLKLN